MQRMARKKPETTDPKVTALRERGCLNPTPDRVTDPLFSQGDFFDSNMPAEMHASAVLVEKALEFSPEGFDVFWETRREPDFDLSIDLLAAQSYIYTSSKEFEI